MKAFHVIWCCKQQKDKGSPAATPRKANQISQWQSQLSVSRYDACLLAHNTAN